MEILRKFIETTLIFQKTRRKHLFFNADKGCGLTETA